MFIEVKEVDVDRKIIINTSLIKIINPPCHTWPDKNDNYYKYVSILYDNNDGYLYVENSYEYIRRILNVQPMTTSNQITEERQITV